MKIKTFATITAVAVTLIACGGDKTETLGLDAATEQTEPLETLDQRLSYIVGENIAVQFQRDGIALDLDALSLAIQEVQAGKELRLSDEEKRSTLTAIQQRAQEQQKIELEALSAKNLEEGKVYLEANGQKEGVVTTASGLQYQEVVAGDGETPTIDDTVTVHYKGTLIDGTVFDSSYLRNQPATFSVRDVIPGWIEALQLMNVGDKFELVIPANIAYGASGTSSGIGPNATLLFEVELLEIAKPEVPAEAASAE